MQPMTRRNFVASATALAGASALAAGATTALAGATDDPNVDASEPIAPVEPPAAWDGEYDVIVVGTGGGLFGATRAAELGAKTLCVDKNWVVGGASGEASIFAVSGTRVQLEAGFPDITAMMCQGSLAKQEEGNCNTTAIVRTCSYSTQVFDWLEGLGCAIAPTREGGPMGGMTGVSPAGADDDLLPARVLIDTYNFLANKFVELGGDLRLGNTVTALVVENGAVVGIQVDDENGDIKHFKAANGVVLATGGFCSNVDMQKKYAPTICNLAKYSSAGPQDTGEGIRMGMGAGGQFAGYDAFQAFDGGINDVPWDYYMYNGDVQLARQAWLSIDCTGKRLPFYPEVSNYTKQAKQLFNCPGAQAYRFFDSHYEEYAEAQMHECCRLLIKPTMSGIDRIPEALCAHDWKIGAQAGIEAGRIKKADTLEEVAEMLGLDPGVVTGAVAAWNELAANCPEEGIDGVPAEWVHPIVDGPFYGVAIGSFVFASQCGLMINEDMQVISTKGTPIPGLHAAGCTVGGLSGPNSSQGVCNHPHGGVAFSAITSFIAAEHCCGTLPAFEMPAWMMPAEEPTA